MVDAVWPAINADPEQGSYSEAAVSNLASFKPDVGPPSTWRRSTLKSTKIQAAFFFTSAELATFRTFFETTLGDGALPFTWTNPVYGVSKRYMFDPENPPQWQPLGSGNAYKVSLSIIKLSA